MEGRQAVSDYIITDNSTLRCKFVDRNFNVIHGLVMVLPVCEFMGMKVAAPPQTIDTDRAYVFYAFTEHGEAVYREAIEGRWLGIPNDSKYGWPL